VVVSDVILGHGLLPRVQDPEDVVLDARGADVEAVRVDGGGVGQVEGVLHELQAVLGAQLVHLCFYPISFQVQKQLQCDIQVAWQAGGAADALIHIIRWKLSQTPTWLILTTSPGLTMITGPGTVPC
jgi:hypothetical protein